VSRKPFLTLVAISAASALAALGITACGSGSSDDATVVQAAATPQFLTESADRTATVESGRFEMSIDIPSSDEVPNGFSIKGSGAFDLQSHRSQTTIDMSGLIDAAKDTEGAEMLALFGDGKFDVITDGDVVYVHAGFLSAFLGGDDSKPWVKIPADQGDEVASDVSGGLADATALLDLLRDKGATVTDEGQADVNGQSTHHLKATISVADALAAAPAESKAKAQELIDQFGAQAGDVDLPLDVFVDDQGFVRRMQMTIDGDAFATLAGPDAATGGPQQMAFTVDFLDLGESVDIQLPPADQVSDGSKLGEQFQGLDTTD
jgi:hypothetical protein